MVGVVFEVHVEGVGRGGQDEAFLLLDFLLDEHALPDGHLEAQCDDERVHFVELAGVGAVDHAVPEELDPLLEVLVEGGVDNFLVAG